jgi:hypothetical protein
MKWPVLLLLGVAVNAMPAEQFLPPVTTGCNDLNDPGRSPGKQFEMFFDIQQPDPVNSIGSNSEKYPEVGSPISPDIDASASDTDFPKQHPNLSDPVKFDRKKLSIHGGYIYYYEPDGKGGRRLCRREEWANRTVMAFKPYTAKRGEYQTIPREKHYGYSGQPLDRAPQPDQVHNPALAEIAKTYVPVSAIRYLYDAAGRLVESMTFDELNWEEGSAKPTNWQFEANHGLQCRLYRPDGKLWRYIHGQIDGADCSHARPNNSNYFEYRYDTNGQYLGSIQNSRTKSENGGGEGWHQTWELSIAGHRVQAEANSEIGVLFVTGAVNRIAPKDNNPLNTNGGVYFFPNHDAPVSLLDDFPKIYNYRRIRERGTGIARMVEAFPAGSSQLTARVWLNTYNNNLLRQEQYKDGKLVRVINTDFADEPTQEYYEEHLEKYAVKIKPANLVQRVYEYDDKGNEKLVAISWTKVPKKEFYGDGASPGRIGPLIDLAKDAKKAWKNRGKPAQPKPARLEFYYGLPDGTVKWKDFEAFQKAFDIQENADWLYPNGQPKRF